MKDSGRVFFVSPPEGRVGSVGHTRTKYMAYGTLTFLEAPSTAIPPRHSTKFGDCAGAVPLCLSLLFCFAFLSPRAQGAKG